MSKILLFRQPDSSGRVIRVEVKDARILNTGHIGRMETMTNQDRQWNEIWFWVALAVGIPLIISLIVILK